MPNLEDPGSRTPGDPISRPARKHQCMPEPVVGRHPAKDHAIKATVHATRSVRRASIEGDCRFFPPVGSSLGGCGLLHFRCVPRFLALVTLAWVVERQPERGHAVIRHGSWLVESRELKERRTCAEHHSLAGPAWGREDGPSKVSSTTRMPRSWQRLEHREGGLGHRLGTPGTGNGLCRTWGSRRGSGGLYPGVS